MNRKKTGITFIVSALITIGILIATFGKPPYMKHCHKNVCDTEVKQNP